MAEKTAQQIGQAKSELWDVAFSQALPAAQASSGNYADACLQLLSISENHVVPKYRQGT